MESLVRFLRVVGGVNTVALNLSRAMMRVPESHLQATYKSHPTTRQTIFTESTSSTSSIDKHQP